MKKYILNSFFALGLLVSVSSCDKTDGALYSPEEDNISFFNASTSLKMEGGSIDIPVARSLTNGELSVPVTLSATGVGYTDIFKLAGPVTFENGSAKSYAKVNYSDYSKIDPSTLSIANVGKDVTVGLAFPFTLTIDPENLSISNKGTVSVLASSILEFEEIGTVTIDSYWEEGEVSCKIQKAKGANVYKLVSPYGDNSIAFMIKSDGKTITCPNQVIVNSYADYGPVTLTTVTGTVVNNVVTLNVAGYRVSAGSFGSGQEIFTLPN